jgi:hypothetical protein
MSSSSPASGSCLASTTSGLALDEDEFADVVDRAVDAELRVQAHGGRRTFIATNAGYRLEVHPPREWLDELLEQRDVLQLTELQLLADDPEAKAKVLAQLLDTELDGASVMVGDSSSASSPAGRRGARSCTASC